jgi:hypothetical protein
LRRAAFLLLACLGLASAAHAQNGSVTGFCTLGATSAQVQGLPSTNRLQGLIPSCQVKVFLAGTQTTATIFSNITGTPLTNPFTASTIGQWSFYATNGESYDVVLSGGVAPLVYPGPVSLPGLMPGFGGSIFSGNINGEMYPAQCGSANPPSWCSGTTPDAWYRAACTQLPSNGGLINLLGTTGNWAATAPCSTPTKQVITLADNTTRINITETDGQISMPQDNGSMLLGQGAGQCANTGGGFRLTSGANITSIVGPVHTDGSQENFTISGVCLFGAAGATVSQGLIYSARNFANTTIDGNNVFVCNTACAKILNNGQTKITNNWFNVSDGLTTITGTPLIIQGSGLGNGCNVGPIDVSGGQIEHALGGGAEVVAKGDGTGGPLACDVHVHDLGIERNPAGTPGVVGVQLEDCKNCSVENVVATGNSSGSQSMVKIIANAGGSAANVVLRNISNVFGSYANTLNDTTATGKTLSSFSTPFITTYYSNPGYVQPPVLPGTTIQSVGADIMAGAGAFATGSGTLPTGFVQTGCNLTGLNCTYTRDGTSPPPGYSFSQHVQITLNTYGGSGFNGDQYGTPVSFTAGQTYTASFWGKGDGSFTGLPTFLLWVSTTPVFYCQGTSPTPFTSTWTLYSFNCTPSTSGTANIAISALTPVGATGTFSFGGFIFSPVIPLTPGSVLQAITPYGIGPITNGFTGTKTAGSCVLTISGGIITNVTGC